MLRNKIIVAYYWISHLSVLNDTKKKTIEHIAVYSESALKEQWLHLTYMGFISHKWY